MENCKNTWMQESAFFAWRERPLTTQLKKKWADTCTDVSGSYLHKKKKQDQVPKLLLTIQFVRSRKDLKTSKQAICFIENVKTYLKRIVLEGEETKKNKLERQMCVAR